MLLENEYFSRRIELKKLTSNEVSTPMMEYGVTQEVSHNENENVLTKYLYVDHKERKDLLYQMTMKFILMSVIMMLAWKVILLLMIKPSIVKIQLYGFMLWKKS